MRKTIEKTCLYCNGIFTATYSEHARGNAKYCDQKCSGKHRKSIMKKHFSDINLPNCVCANCAKEFYRSKTKREISKSGLHFCSRLCKDHGQRIENGNKAMWPDHFDTGTGRYSYRSRAMRNFAHICMACGYNKQPEILEVHHKDHDRTNNTVENLEVLCPNCHSEHHFWSKTGKWTEQKTFKPI